MKALTLHQPWATLIAIGAKRIETRAWGTQYRGPLAIHAGREQRRARDLWEDDVFRQVLLQSGLRPRDLPYGGVVAIVTLVDTVRTVDLESDPRLTQLERAFGDYDYGRWGWVLESPTVVWAPCAGQRGLWEWDRPALAHTGKS